MDALSVLLEKWICQVRGVKWLSEKGGKGSEAGQRWNAPED